MPSGRKLIQIRRAESVHSGRTLFCFVVSFDTHSIRQVDLKVSNEEGKRAEGTEEGYTDHTQSSVCVYEYPDIFSITTSHFNRRLNYNYESLDWF